jgi:imidazoleglycerol-phosphate dehydratase
MPDRLARIERRTTETAIELTLHLDGTGVSDIRTGIGALDHFLTLFARHGLFDLHLRCEGDLTVDGHHTAEDVAICLGQAIRSALGDHRGLRRTADVAVPMDEALAHVAIDIAGRSYFVLRGAFSATHVGDLETDLVCHFFDTLSREARMNIHVVSLYGMNAHHEVEALFKAFGRSLDAATRIDERMAGRLPSTKEHIEGAAGRSRSDSRPESA